MSDHEHDRFLYQEDGYLHFGCVNPFCGHGNPALPKHYKVPQDSKDVAMQLLSHKHREMEIEVWPKDESYGPAILKCADNLEACRERFKALQFPKREVA